LTFGNGQKKVTTRAGKNFATKISSIGKFFQSFETTYVPLAHSLLVELYLCLTLNIPGIGGASGVCIVIRCGHIDSYLKFYGDSKNQKFNFVALILFEL